MTKYSKGITVAKGVSILVIDKNSFEECNKEIIEELDNNSNISEKDKKEFKELIL